MNEIEKAINLLSIEELKKISINAIKILYHHFIMYNLTIKEMIEKLKE